MKINLSAGHIVCGGVLAKHAQALDSMPSMGRELTFFMFSVTLILLGICMAILNSFYFVSKFLFWVIGSYLGLVH